MGEYSITSPFIVFRFEDQPRTAVVAVIAAFEMVATLAIAYLYVVAAPEYFGFKTTVLIGVFYAVCRLELMARD